MSGVETSVAQVVVALAKDLGPVGLVVLFGYLNMRWVDTKLDSQRAAHEKERAEWRVQFETLTSRYDSHMAEQRQMYKSNVSLVEGYERLSEELMGVVTLATQTMTELVHLIKNNLFCPMMRKGGPQG